MRGVDKKQDTRLIICVYLIGLPPPLPLAITIVEHFMKFLKFKIVFEAEHARRCLRSNVCLKNLTVFAFPLLLYEVGCFIGNAMCMVWSE